MLKWFKVKRRQNAILSGLILMVKADDFMRQHKIDNFKKEAQNCLRRSQSMSKLLSRSQCGGYKDKENFNVDETVLFFRILSNNRMNFKGEKLCKRKDV